MRSLFFKCLLMFVMGSSLSLFATPVGFTYQGKIYKANGNEPLQEPAVVFKVQIRSPDAQCILFEETHSRDMSGTEGNFSLIIGEGSNTNATSLNLLQVFDNSNAKVGFGGCNYTPSVNDFRRLRFSYDDGTTVVTLTGDQTIRSVPFAINATALGGLTKDSFIQISAQTTQLKLDNLLAQSAPLLSLAAGTSPQYIKASELPTSGGFLNLSSTGVQVPDAPASASYAVNKNYADSFIGGRAIDLSTMTNGTLLSWNSISNKWVGRSIASSDITTALNFTPVNKAGDTFSGAINMGGNNITQTGYITMNPGKYLSLGSFDAAAETNLITTILTPGGNSYAGVTWYNSVTKSIKYWDGTLAVALTEHLGGTVKSITAGAGLSGGTITNSGTISLPNVGAVGTFTKITTDAQGRVSAGATLSATDIPSASGDVSGSYDNLSVVKIQGVNIANSAPAPGQVLSYNSTNTRWEPLSIITNLNAASPLSVATGSSDRTISLVNGQTPGQAMIWTNSSWEIAFPNASQLRGVAAARQLPTSCSTNQIWSYQVPSDTYACVNIAISASQISGLGTAAALNVGTSASHVVQIDSNGRLPAVDGSQLTNLNVEAPFKNIQVLSTPGPASSWLVPPGVKRIFVEVWGGGGGGSGGKTSSSGGTGGGSGAYGAWFKTVVPGDSITFTVGDGGGGGNANSDGTNGFASIFDGTSIAGGQAGTNASPGAAVSGPSGSSIIGINGAAGSFGSIQGIQTSVLEILGVSVLGSTSISGLGGNGGAAPKGGTSGTGSSSSLTAGSNGGAPGGGGGGGGNSLGSGGSSGGKGGAGRIIIWH
ncbi:MAG: hypothetical protein JNL11_11260 [Bdellovibrionaceae bacterium]|nr:hypothetical protein [Pseudobdellovibrionaceae bacterium]